MPFEIVRNDITRMQVDAIVNTANPRPVVGAGTDAMIHAKAGPKLLQTRQRIGTIGVGQAYITPAFELDAKYVIHTVGPVWIDGTHQEEHALRQCYANSLELAVAHGCESIAFPLISAGTYGFPKDRALQIAIEVFSAFLLKYDLQITLVVFNASAYRLSEKLFHNVASFIDQNYVDQYEGFVSGMPSEARSRRRRDLPMLDVERYEAAVLREEMVPCAPTPKAQSLWEKLKQADAGFSETLAKRIEQSGKKKSEIYKKANLTKQHFSKILNNPDYKPTKPTALALAIALELNLEQTRDLIGRAGFALTNSSRFDLIVMYFIENGIYNVVEINLALYEFAQPLLGAKDC